MNKLIESRDTYVPGVATVPCQGGELIETNTFLMRFHAFYKKKKGKVMNTFYSILTTNSNK